MLEIIHKRSLSQNEWALSCVNQNECLSYLSLSVSLRALKTCLPDIVYHARLYKSQISHENNLYSLFATYRLKASQRYQFTNFWSKAHILRIQFLRVLDRRGTNFFGVKKHHQRGAIRCLCISHGLVFCFGEYIHHIHT